MALSTNAINNALLNQYRAQIKNNNNSSDKSTMGLQDEKAMQDLAFQTMLIQIMDSSDNSMMAELMSTALSKQESLNLDSSLGAMSSFNSIMRDATKSLLNDDSQVVNTRFNGLGDTSSKYESNANPGTISNTPGDYGGKSYGAWQFSSKTGSLDSFVDSLQTKDNEVYLKLSEAKVKDGNSFGKNFDSAWISISLSDKDKFLNLQKDCIKQNYYDTAAQALRLKYGFDINKKGEALKESLFSTVVQHGVGGTLSVFSKLNLNNSDGNIINDLYNERQKVNLYFKSSSSEIKQSVYNRFTKEKQDMLSMLNRESV